MFFVPDFSSCMVPLTEEIGAKDSVFLSVDHIACIRSTSITCAILESLYELVIKRQSLVCPKIVRKQGTVRSVVIVSAMVNPLRHRLLHLRM